MLTLNKGEGTSFNSTSQGVQMKTITSSSNSSKFKQKTTSQAKLELECCVRECEISPSFCSQHFFRLTDLSVEIQN